MTGDCERLGCRRKKAKVQSPAGFVKGWGGGGGSECCWLILRKDCKTGSMPTLTATLLGSLGLAEKGLALLLSFSNKYTVE